VVHRITFTSDIARVAVYFIQDQNPNRQGTQRRRRIAAYEDQQGAVLTGFHFISTESVFSPPRGVIIKSVSDGEIISLNAGG